MSIQASVRDKRGRPVPGLTGTDFEVRDNGELKAVLSLRSDSESPLSLVVLVDMSGSMSVGPKIAMARRAFASLLSQLRDGRQGVAVFAFDWAFHERRSFTTSIAGLTNVLRDFRAIRIHVALRRHRRRRTATGGPVGDPQSHHRPDGRDRHEQHADSARSLRPRELD